jgi:acyl carrier protein
VSGAKGKNNMQDRYEQVFRRVFNLSEAEKPETLEYQAIKQWDSVGHMALIATIESEFSIELEVDDVIDFSSFEEGRKILEKYGISE